MYLFQLVKVQENNSKLLNKLNPPQEFIVMTLEKAVSCRQPRKRPLKAGLHSIAMVFMSVSKQDDDMATVQGRGAF